MESTKIKTMDHSSTLTVTRLKKRRNKYTEEDQYRNIPQQKPINQEKLTSEELQQEFVKTLTTFDPLKQKNLIVWDFKESTFIPLEEESQFVTLFSMPSELVDMSVTDEMDGEGMGELIDDISDKEEDDDVVKKVVEKVEPEIVARIITSKIGSVVLNAPPKIDEDLDELEDEKDEGGTTEPPRKLLNLFNYCERSAQTHPVQLRVHSVQTDNPVRSNHKDICNQWIIYDAYKADAVNRPKEQSQRQKEDHEHEHEQDEHGDEHVLDKPKDHTKKDESKIPERPGVKMRKASYLTEGYTGGGEQGVLLKATDGLRFMERLVGNNAFEDVVEDFKYYEDGADEYRDQSELVYGTLLPLWKFTFDKAKKMHITSISWSQSQPDMFAVTYGSFHFTHPVRNGLVVIYTLRNCTYPEFVWTTPKGAMSNHIHPQRHCLVAVGLYDGNVGVLNLEKDDETKSQVDVLRNIPLIQKHGAPVWAVHWGPDDDDGNPQFYSAGMDGKFIIWTVGVSDIQNIGGLQGTQLANFYLPVNPVHGPDGIKYKLFGCARVISFHPKNINLFLLGTAEGKIFKCSALYASKFQTIFDAHFLPVAGLEWNHYHVDIFISCSEDWTIKIWDQASLSPMYVFETGVPILSVCWAPYSSTLFVASTETGKVLIYDLIVNKERPICSQQVVAKKKVHPHRIQFNPVYPIIIVGDDRSSLNTLKLSPNLRIMPKDARNIFYLEGDARIQFEINKLKKLLSLVRDPESVPLDESNKNQMSELLLYKN